ncbi:MAG TPA: cytochrome c3 family protein [Bryobacteraceae bacterium]|nr:cytochrome c3 family protein [Bryobacteraceae bacterium]HOL72050.1 cytochrome c3 family protein [Bryobacteraceae bacterium]HOQ46652.1 cytochrome c3 family protein [Bryobacteraceae bacterium]HPQ16884.1 cytochrome c3 family protein [Bryobacteraceae bacterium]HPU72322.1 cytochrome c3 family protein [Bryobacteraceae bacterium]
MRSRVLTIVLGIGVAFSLVVLASRASMFHLPANHQGYEPVQPIAYSHRLHAGELQIDCKYCHFGAEKSRYAGIPPASVCMNCHQFIKAPLGAIRAEDELAAQEGRAPREVVSPELSRLYDAVKQHRPVAWTRIHSLPDFVYFDHRAHVNAGVVCQQCHGPVETMERVRQVSDLSMGWCVNCHRDANEKGIGGRRVNASINCSTCHY